MTTRKLWLWTTLAGMAGTAAVFAFTLGDAPDIRGLRPERLTRGPIASVLRLSGTLQPRRRHNVSFGSAGRVEGVFVQTGASVRKGDLLGRLESSQARFLARRRELELRRARAKSTGSESDDPDRRALAVLDVEQAELELDFARQQLANLEARSPATGVIAFVGAQAGDSASLGAPSFVVIEDGEYAVDAEGEEADVRGATADSEAVVTFASPDITIRGRVDGKPVLRRLAANGAPSQWGLHIRLFQNPDDPVIGRTARVEIQTGRRPDVVLAPLQALFRFNGADHVLVSDRAGGWRPAAVTVGLSDESVAEIIEGPPAGTAVLTGPSDRLRAFVGAVAER